MTEHDSLLRLNEFSAIAAPFANPSFHFPVIRLFHGELHRYSLAMAFLRFPLIALSAALVLCAPPSSFAAVAPTEASVAASDPRFRYEGRFDFTDASAPIVIWQASRIYIDFEGDTLGLRFDEVKGQAVFDAEIDGLTTLVDLRERSEPQGAQFSKLGGGRHRLKLFKRSEASAGSARFRGVGLATGAQAYSSPAPTYRLKIEFFGDSITAGACNEDGPTDQWQDRSTHNAALSYGAFAAGAFHADFRDIAVSGMGIVTGYTPVKAGEMWNAVYPTAASPRANLSTWKPDVLFINLGENDDSFTKGRQQPFPDEAYTNGYVSLVQSFRTAYPAAQIVILRGGMMGGARSERLRKPWDAAVAKVEAADSHVTHFVFTHVSAHHPRVGDHWAMAAELIAWLRQQEFMAKVR